MDSYFEWLHSALENYGVGLLFGLLLLENFPFIGFFTPAISALIIVGFVKHGDVQFLGIVWAFSVAALVVGDNLWYFLGRRTEGKWRVFSSLNSRANSVLEVIEEQHRLALTLYQFPPYFRMFMPFALGVKAYAFRKWIAINLIGSILYVSAFLGIGCFARATFGDIAKTGDIARFVSMAITVVAIAYLLELARRYIRKRGSSIESDDERC